MNYAILIRHLARTIGATLLTVSVLFLLSHAATTPETLLQSILDGASRSGNTAQQSAAVEHLFHRYGLDAPLFYVGWTSGAGWHWNGWHNQYHQWLMDLLRGNLGYSYQSDTAVAELIGQALGYTLPLTLLAATGSIVLALCTTVAVSFRPRARRWFLRITHVLQSFPLFLLALSLLLLLANPDALSWFPAFSMGVDVSLSAWQHPMQLLYQLALPAASLILGSFPGLAIQLDGALQQELVRPYIATARAKGASPSQVVWRHALRNALLPVVALLIDLVPAIVAGSVVVEVVFALPGMGRLITDAAVRQDLPVLLGAVGLVALVRLLAQFAADVLYPVLDPRLRAVV